MHETSLRLAGIIGRPRYRDLLPALFGIGSRLVPAVPRPVRRLVRLCAKKCSLFSRAVDSLDCKIGRVT
jgi:hypothetical protein